MAFNRSLTIQELEDWDNLIQDLHLEDTQDEVTWGLERSGVFTTKSLYGFITLGGVESHLDKHLWKSKLPMKIKVFVWQIYHGKLQAAAVLKARGWKGDHHCALCGATEFIDHTFFSCPLGVFVWSCLRDSIGWDGFPTSTTELMNGWLNKPTTSKHIGLFFFAGFLWAIWRNRNKMAIERKFPRSPSEVLWCGISFVQRWEILLRGEIDPRLKAQDCN